ncbi:MAG: DUF512 domain-containing protein [Gemmatimonadota bacterium]|nr:DUF512 domain-containing protein [Gemmatimonadota bacterium]
MVRIAEIESGSIADDLHLEIGTRILRINGKRIRDGIDLMFLLANGSLELETVTPGGEVAFYEIERDPGESIGIIPNADKIRECGNKCVFCFIDGNPKDARDSLWLRDDDFRLSFTYGSYVTLTNVGPRGMERLVEQRISPLYVSVHATDPDVRTRLLVNDRAGLIMDQLRYLIDNDLEIHTQIVLCPEWNDGPHLDRTMEDLYGLGNGVISLSVVPVGLTKYNEGRPVRRITSAEAKIAIRQVDRMRAKAFGERSRGWCYSADELYLIAGQHLPPDDYYDEGVLTENGVGAIKRFLREFEADLHGLPHLPERRLRIVTGTSMERFLRQKAPRLAQVTGARVDVQGIKNCFYGENVTVAGLLGGEDIVSGLGTTQQDDVILVTAEALNADDLFVDGLSISKVRKALEPATVVTGYGVSECLTSL